jgi:hypothetical protein
MDGVHALIFKDGRRPASDLGRTALDAAHVASMQQRNNMATVQLRYDVRRPALLIFEYVGLPINYNRCKVDKVVTVFMVNSPDRCGKNKGRPGTFFFKLYALRNFDYNLNIENRGL